MPDTVGCNTCKCDKIVFRGVTVCKHYATVKALRLRCTLLSVVMFVRSQLVGLCQHICTTLNNWRV